VTIVHTSLTRVVFGILLLSLLGYGYSAVATMHIHVLPDGRIVVHSHPTTNDAGGEGESHSHSDSELSFLAQVSRLFDNSTPIIHSVPVFTFAALAETIAEHHYSAVEAYHNSTTERAPPRVV
jgi:hypothetical protein